MAKDTKIIHIQIVDAELMHIKALKDNLKLLKDKLPYDVEFVVTNDKVEMRDIAWLIKELMILYKLDKKKVKKDESKH